MTRKNLLWVHAALALALLGHLPYLPGQAIVGASNGLTSPAQTITFDSDVVDNSTLAIDLWASVGVVFGPNLWIQYPHGGNGDLLFGPAVYNFACDDEGCGGDILLTYSIYFLNPVSAVAFNYISAPGASTFAAFLAGNSVDSFTTPTGIDGAQYWYGFQNTTFDEIRISLTSGAFGLDNLQATPATTVPEPATMTLLAGGLLGVGAARRKHKRH